MKDMKFCTAGEYAEDLLWVLPPHGRSEQMAQWVIDNYGERDDYESNATVQAWVRASQQVLTQGE